MRALAHLRTPAIAIVAILALLLVPACGSLCSAMNHCSASTVSANSDACHHSDMSAQSGSETLSFSSPGSCGQQTPPQAILAGPESSTQLKFVFAARTPSLNNISASAITWNSRPYQSPSAEESPQSIPLENLSVLRI
jgi:hypothetical protein